MARHPPDTPAVVTVTATSASRRAEQEAVAAGAPGESGLQDRLAFERLLSELGTTFVSLRAEEIDVHIEAALRAIVEFLGIDRANIFQFSHDATDSSQWHVTHSWAVGGMSTLQRPSVPKFPWMLSRVLQGETIVLNRIADLPPEAAADADGFRSIGARSHVTVPLTVGGAIVGTLSLGKIRDEITWPAQIVQRLRILATIIANALARKKADLALHASLQEIEDLRDRLRQENTYLRQEIALQHRHEEVVGRGGGITKVLERVEQVAATPTTVLLLGETGTGKELLARAIHSLSGRSERAMVKVNCAALPAALVESELFGREKGAYTGALTEEIGRFEVADGSTIFLDEIGELPLELQAKLLRVLQEGEFERLGSTKTIKVDVRVIAATNRDLAAAVRDKSFRADLYYRLNVFPIVVPPLRERREDIAPLVWAAVREFAASMGKLIDTIPDRTMRALQAYAWPGNVRELRNVIERAMILSRGGILEVELPAEAALSPPDTLRLDDVERRHILRVLEKTGWRVRGTDGAAAKLGLKPTTLDSRIQKLGLRRPDTQRA